MTGAVDVEAPLSERSEAGLAALAAGAGAISGRIAAVGELARRRSPSAPRALAALVAEPGAPPALRGAAATALATFAAPETTRLLLPGLRAGEPEVVRRAALALGRVGGPEALAELREAPVPPEPAAQRALAFARNLVAYRHGLTVERLTPAPPAALLPLPASGLRTLEPASMTLEAARGLAAAVEKEAPGVALSLEGGAVMTCGNNHLALLPARGAADLRRSSAVPAVLFRQPVCPHSWSVALYILSHPLRDGVVALFGVRPDGMLTHAGEAQAAGGVMRFRVGALNTPYSPPFVIEGSLDPAASRIEVTRAEAAPRKAEGQPRGREPSRDRD